MLYGYPGSGKTYFARQLCEQIQAAHVQGDRIRSELFDEPRHDREENSVVTHLMDYMTEEFLNAGVSVVYDVNAVRQSQRHDLREIARRHKAQPVLVWLQIDVDSAYGRVSKRDRRHIDDKYTVSVDRAKFDGLTSGMQNPSNVEDYAVISGKHIFNTQFSTAIKKMHEMSLINSDQMANKIVKPGMVNLVPKSQKSPMSQTGNTLADVNRRSIVIR